MSGVVAVLLVALAAWALLGFVALALGRISFGSKRLVRRCRRWIVRRGEPFDVVLSCSGHGLRPARDSSRCFAFVLAIDSSGSMGDGPGSPLAHARRAAVAFVRNVASEDCRVAVVDFDHSARIVHPLSSNGRAVARSIMRIGGGGGTNIHLALDRCRRALEAAVDYESPAVIVLSDGCSSPLPALAEAGELRAEGVRVSTIAFGTDVNRELLSAIASSEEDFHATLDKVELGRLYREIADGISSTVGFDGHLHEQIPSGRMLLDDAGQANVLVEELAGGRLEWFLPAVRPEPQDVSYRIVATRYGWHPIATSRAILEMRGCEGNEIRALSGRPQHVLVLPEPWWLWMWLLTPIYWMVASRARAPRPIELPAHPRVPPPTMPEAVPLERSLKVPKPPEVSPTLFLGLGGTGIRALQRLRALLDRLELDPDESLRWLSIDTDARREDPPGSAPLRDADRVCIGCDLTPLFAGLETLGGERPPHLEWLDVARELKTLRPTDFDTSSGTHGRRSLGRAALYRQLGGIDGPDGAPELLDAIGGRLRELGEAPRVVVAGSASGGTAGGTLVDALVLVQKAARAVGVQTPAVDVALLCPPSDQAHSSPTFLPNSHALVVELTRILARPQAAMRLPQWAGEGEPPRLRRLIDRLIWVERPLDRESSTWPETIESAAGILLHDALVDTEADEHAPRSEALGSPAEVGAWAAACSTRSVPVDIARRICAEKAGLRLVVQGLLGLEEAGGELRVPEGVPEEAQRLVEDLLHSEHCPRLFIRMQAIADRDVAATEIPATLAALEHYPGSDTLPVWLESDHLRSAVLRTEQLRLFRLLEGWCVDALAAATEGGALCRLRAATDRLLAGAVAALGHLEETEDEFREQQMGARHGLLHLLFDRYRQVLLSLSTHLDDWWQLLAGEPDPQDPERNEPVSGLLRARLDEAWSELRTRRRQLGEAVVWDERVERALDRATSAASSAASRQIGWLAARGEDHLGVGVALRIQSGERHLFGRPEDPHEVAKALGSLVDQITGDALAELRVDAFVELERWVRHCGTLDPAGIDDSLNSLLMETPVSGRLEVRACADDLDRVRTAIGMDGRVQNGLDAGSISVVRWIHPVSPFATSALLRFNDSAPSSFGDLVFLDRADFLAAAHVAQLGRFGIASDPFCSLVRAYYCDWQSLRAVVIAIGFGRVEARGAGWALGDRSVAEDGEGPLHLRILDNLVIHGALESGARIDTAGLAAEAEAILRDAQTEDISARLRQPHGSLRLEVGSERVASDLERLWRLFLSLELERRARANGEPESG